MITGVVTEELEAVVAITIRDHAGNPYPMKTVVDTGYNGFLTLPPHLVSQLQLIFAGPAKATLGDGSEITSSLFEGVVIWQGADRLIGVLQTDGDPVIGMSLLRGSDLAMRVIAGGAVTIKPTA